MWQIPTGTIEIAIIIKQNCSYNGEIEVGPDLTKRTHFLARTNYSQNASVPECLTT